MSRYDGGWPPYVPVAERRRRALRAIENMRRNGQPIAPVAVHGLAIATSFWGKAWCENLESYRDYESRLPRGRTYVRNGSVLDLQIAPAEVAATVSGSSIYQVRISIAGVGKKQWAAICKECAGGIDSLVELLQGRFSQGVMERLCRQDNGLFPKPSEIRFSCSCPDYASMCKHVAAVLYGVGARLDQKPELLFRLRAVDETELVAGIDATLPAGKRAPSPDRVLASDDLSGLFGMDIDPGEQAAKPSDHRRRAQSERASTRKPSRTKSNATPKAPAGKVPPPPVQAGSTASVRRSSRSGSSAPRSVPPKATAKVKRRKTTRRRTAADA